MPCVLIAVVIGTTGVPILTAVIVRPPPLAIAFVHGRYPIVSQFELMTFGLDEGSAIYETLPVDDYGIFALTVLAA
jgi:hypothetical protein